MLGGKNPENLISKGWSDDVDVQEVQDSNIKSIYMLKDPASLCPGEKSLGAVQNKPDWSADL